MKKLLMISICLALPLSWASADSRKARVVTDVSKPVSCISAVAIQSLNGEEVAINPRQFELEPGMHTMNGRTMMDTTYCATIRGKDRIRVEPLSAMFEAGKTYYVGFDHSSSHKEDWKLVVWKVEEES